MTASEIAAWWGATVATIVFLWDIVKWRGTRARLCVDATVNMQTFDAIAGKLVDDKLIHVEVVNIGRQPTTVTKLWVAYYPNFWARLRRRSPMKGMVLEPQGPPLPTKLGPGEGWAGMIDQTDIEKKIIANGSALGGKLLCAVSHTHRPKGDGVYVHLSR